MPGKNRSFKRIRHDSFGRLECTQETLKDPRAKLRDVLLQVRSLLALPNNSYLWSSWEDAEAALREVDGLIADLEAGRTPPRLTLQVLFAPTGPIQEVSLSSGWGNEFLILAEEFDAAEKAFYSP